MKKPNERKSLEYYLRLRYPVTLVPEAEGGYTVLIPDLPGCMSVGETPDEAMQMIEDARVGWIKVAYEYGDDIPLPSTQREYSGRVLLRMSPSLHRRLAESANSENLSLNQYICGLLTEQSAVLGVHKQLQMLLGEMQTIRK